MQALFLSDRVSFDDNRDSHSTFHGLKVLNAAGALKRYFLDCTSDRCDVLRTILLRNIAIGRNMNRSANSAAIMATALSQPKRRSDGRLDRTVIASPQASTADVKINGGPTRIVARSTPTAGSGSVSSICNLFRK